MQRRAPGDSVARFRFARARREADPIRAGLLAVASQFTSEIQRTYFDLPDLPFLTDRDEELFAPLFAVCAVLAPGRLGELKNSAKRLCELKADDTVDSSLSLRLLSDMRAILASDADRILTEQVLARLRQMPESPWNKEPELTPMKMARLLREFGIRPRTVRVDEKHGRGYIREELDLAWSRYLPPKELLADSEACQA
jgi:uncharacterized protein DUF3631